METCSTTPCGTCGPWWRLPLMLALVLAAVALLRRNPDMRETSDPGAEPSAATSASAEAGKAVSLEIDFGDERREFGAVAWHEGMTVRDAVAAAGDSTGGVKFVQQGRNESAFLTEIDGIRNEGAGGRNWTFEVNGEYGDRSFAVYELEPGDKVLWTFAESK